MSTPRSLELPDGVRPATIRTSRGSFAALDAMPVSEVCEREPALLVPGYTGSKEDFIAILGLLADHSRRVIAIDMRGQYETPGPGDDDGYSAAAFGADIAAVIEATGAKHLLGHSYGGLMVRETLLETTAEVSSLTLMSSGPAGVTGPRAEELTGVLAVLGENPSPAKLRASIDTLWRDYLEPQAVASGVPGPIIAFLGKRMLSNDPQGLLQMAHHLLAAPDRTAELTRRARAGRITTLVIYGENDNAWAPDTQEQMARRLGASRVCIPGAAHSPAVEAPATTSAALTRFWDTAEATGPARPRDAG